MNKDFNHNSLFKDRNLAPVAYYKGSKTILAYRYTHSNNNKETILFFYGFAGSMDMVEDFMVSIRHHYDVIVIDYPGHGYSEKLTELSGAGFSIEEFVDTSNKILEHLNIRSINLIGYSFGGIIAFQFYKSYKDKVKKFVLYHTLPKFSLNIIQNIFYKFYGFLLKHFYLGLITKISIPLLKDKHLTKNNYKDAITIVKHADPKSVLANFNKIIFADYTSVLEQIDCPVFVIGSTKDILAPTFAVKKMVKKIKGAKLVMLKEYGHLSIVTATDILPKIIIDFLQGRKV